MSVSHMTAVFTRSLVVSVGVLRFRDKQSASRHNYAINRHNSRMVMNNAAETPTYALKNGFEVREATISFGGLRSLTFGARL